MASDTSKRRSYAEETTFIRETGKVRHEYNIDIGFVPNMRVPVRFYANETLYPLLTGELKLYSENPSGRGGFLPGLKQMANVAALPGIVGASVGLPDCHSGYGFAIGNVAAFDGADPSAVVSPGGVGFDINCGVRLLRTNLSASDLGVRGYGDDDDDRGGVGVGGEIATSPPSAVCESLCQKLFDHIPVGVGSRGVIPSSPSDLEASLALGMDWSLREGYAWAEDKEHCEEQGRMLTADASAVSRRAKKRGLPQLGTLGAGNHYCEVQVVDEVMDRAAAERMGIGRRGQVCVMIHSGSRGLGHQVATDALVAMDSSSSSAAIATNDRQLACARISGEAGQRYLRSMAAAANYAWVNRSAMTFLARQAFAKEFSLTPDDLEMGVVYDVSHNIAKWEEHVVGKEEQAALFHGSAAVLGAGANAAAAAAAAKTAPSNLGKTGGWGMPRRLLVHRKGATRAFPPLHPLVPVDYQLTGQPVLIGGTMGTCSYVLTGSELGMQRSFGSTCHGAGRAKSRAASRRTLDYDKVLGGLHKRGISIRVASPKLVMEEAPESYKDVSAVVRTCEEAGISSTAVRLRPVAVVKG